MPYEQKFQVAPKPNHSLRAFVQSELLSKEDWDELWRTMDAKKPSESWEITGATAKRFSPPPSADYDRKIELHAKILKEFRSALQSGNWRVEGIAPNGHRHDEIAIDVIVSIDDVSFLSNRIGGYRHVRVRDASIENRHKKLISFIEICCETIPPKHGVTKGNIADLADKILDFQVREDLFKVAWADAKISKEWRKPGR